MHKSNKIPASQKEEKCCLKLPKNTFVHVTFQSVQNHSKSFLFSSPHLTLSFFTVVVNRAQSCDMYPF